MSFHDQLRKERIKIMTEPITPGTALAMGTMSKAELLSLARSLGLEPPQSANKRSLRLAINAKRQSLKAEAALKDDES